MTNVAENPLAAFEAGLAEVPEPLRRQVSVKWRDFQPRIDGLSLQAIDGKSWLHSLPIVWAYSDFAVRACLRHPALFRELVNAGTLFRRTASGELAQGVYEAVSRVADETELRKVLRRLRQQELLRVAWRDLSGWADLDEVMATLSELADACVNEALAWITRQAVTTQGRAIGHDSGEAQALVVLALGKLGGGELNFSSDIDLVFAYPEEGETDGARPVSNHEFFLRLAQKLIAVLSDVTEDGFVFRVDMRLRPNGNSGPLVLSFDAMEHYYQTHGRDWERYAMIKARVIAGDRAAGEALLASLRPFVYRKYLDYGAVEAIRDMKSLIDDELKRKGMQENIKLGPGGIREIEFIGQAWQLIRGGRETDLQQHGILKVLSLLGEKGALTARTVSDLNSAYRVLRNTEHRLQMFDDQQRHELPKNDLEKLRLAASMGFDDWLSYDDARRRIMQRVHEHFAQMFSAPQRDDGARTDEGLLGVWLGTLDRDTACMLLTETGYSAPDDILMLLRGLREGRAYVTFASTSRARMDRLMPLLLGAAALTPDPLMTMSRLVTLLEGIGQRSTYLALLVENPMALSQLVKLCAASPWIANWISSHPILLDELLNPVELYRPTRRDELEAELIQELERVDHADLEAQMDVLREFRHSHVLRVAAADIGPGLAPEEVGTCLSNVAGAALEQSLRLAFEGLEQKHGRPACRQAGDDDGPGFAVIGYGKLGSLELGYASDLDMIFLYEGCRDGGTTDGHRPLPNEVFFARLGQRLIHLLTARTAAGQLYEVDMRLRPSGQSGPLVTSLEAFQQYQRKSAWIWEHQALVRARPVAGKPALHQAFADIRREILCQRRDPGRLQDEVGGMREKIAAAQAAHDAGLYDVKHDRGGIVDIEFMVQYWVLRWAVDHHELAQSTDNIHLLEALAATGLLDDERTRLLTEAYRRYLSSEHRSKLMERGSLIARTEVGEYPARVARIWNEVFGR